jgi:MSHA biogenesis protein MshP
MTRTGLHHGISRRAQVGAALFSAVFLITAIALIALAISATVGERSITTAQNLQASRAYYAARSGLEVGVARALAGNCSAANFTLDGFAVAVTCAAQPGHDEAGTVYSTYLVTARATAGTLESSSFVSRRLTAQVTDG